MLCAREIETLELSASGSFAHSVTFHKPLNYSITKRSFCRLCLSSAALVGIVWTSTLSDESAKFFYYAIRQNNLNFRDKLLI